MPQLLMLATEQLLVEGHVFSRLKIGFKSKCMFTQFNIQQFSTGKTQVGPKAQRQINLYNIFQI